VIAAVTPLGTVRIAVWTVSHPFREAPHNVKVLAGAIPFLLLTLAFLLLTNELWTVATHLSTVEFVGTLSLFALLGFALFLFEAVRIEKAAEFRDWTAVRRAMRDDRNQPVPPIEALVDDCLANADSLGSNVPGWLAERLKAAAAADPADEEDIDREARAASQSSARLSVGQDRFYACEPMAPLPAIEEVTDLKFLERCNITFIVAFALSVQMLTVSVVMGAFFSHVWPPRGRPRNAGRLERHAG
jgi:hypothetical protein